MTASARRVPIEPKAFIAWENRQRLRYELIGGVVTMMTGGTRARDLIAMSIARLLGNALVGTPCRVHGSNLKVSAPRGAVMYPDVFVRCGPAADDATEVDDPVVVVEVLSPRTKRYDMLEKRWAYQSIPSLRHLLLVSPTMPLVEVETRQAEGSWLAVLVQGLAATVPITSLGIELAMSEIYADTNVAG